MEEKKRNPNFIYIKSDLLKQIVAVSKKTGWVHCEDGVKYSPAEMEVIGRAGGVLDMETHMVKKIIGGEVVGCEQAGSGDKGKPVESGSAKSADNAGGVERKVDQAPAAGAGNESGELDIY